MMENLWVIYVTSGREKCEYRTDLIGLFENVDEGRAKLLRYLIDEGRLFSMIEGSEYINNESDDNNWKECNMEELDADEIETFLKTKESLKHGTISEELFDECMKYEDSYFQDGWDYSIKLINVRKLNKLLKSESE